MHYAPVESGNRAIIVFLTVCTKNRQKALATPTFHLALRAAWQSADHWLVGRYVIMPDHLHLFCAPNVVPAPALAGWVRHWKTKVSKTVGAAEGTLWQIDFWDTQLRQRDSYASKWEYVRHNPVRAGLVVSAADWPHQGELNVLRWHE